MSKPELPRAPAAFELPASAEEAAKPASRLSLLRAMLTRRGSPGSKFKHLFQRRESPVKQLEPAIMAHKVWHEALLQSYEEDCAAYHKAEAGISAAGDDPYRKEVLLLKLKDNLEIASGTYRVLTKNRERIDELFSNWMRDHRFGEFVNESTTKSTLIGNKSSSPLLDRLVLARKEQEMMEEGQRTLETLRKDIERQVACVQTIDRQSVLGTSITSKPDHDLGEAQSRVGTAEEGVGARPQSPHTALLQHAAAESTEQFDTQSPSSSMASERRDRREHTLQSFRERSLDEGVDPRDRFASEATGTETAKQPDWWASAIKSLSDGTSKRDLERMSGASDGSHDQPHRREPVSAAQVWGEPTPHVPAQLSAEDALVRQGSSASLEAHDLGRTARISAVLDQDNLEEWANRRTDTSRQTSVTDAREESPAIRAAARNSNSPRDPTSHPSDTLGEQQRNAAYGPPAGKSVRLRR